MKSTGQTLRAVSVLIAAAALVAAILLGPQGHFKIYLVPTLTLVVAIVIDALSYFALMFAH
ncbi:hypothetical protein C1J03_15445 [Sulfitobacter sp. SK012]|uniref:hypothetical protein n=1 Tax=Sulfitobacter sp. SK012 TaxID=1389005 RepID=UPI000E0B9459|nr:hypothetical protein [Sulfitobacter sp. SK012]AXI47281.1 hypothetical protein C1J03_15445 [Sulfitobacter sp. SK012]